MTQHYRVDPSLEHLLAPVESVNQHPMNPNNGDVDVVVESIQRNGFRDAITVSTRDGLNYIVEGHTRYAAVLSLGGTEIPVVWQDFATEKDEIRYLLAHNRTNRLGKDDLATLHDALATLDEEQYGLVGTGFDDMFLGNLSHMLSQPLDLGDQSADPEYAKQRGARQITCPNCGHTFGGGH